MSNKVPRITKYRQDGIPKARKEKGGSTNNKLANMSTEEFGELFDRDMSTEPVIPEGMVVDEVHEPKQDWPGWSADDIAVFDDTSAIHNEDSSIVQEAMEEVTAESEERKEEAVMGHPRRTSAVAKKTAQKTKTTATGKTTKPLVQSSLAAAVAKGTAAKETMERNLKPAASVQPAAGTIGPKSTMKDPLKTTETTTMQTVEISSLAAAVAAGKTVIRTEPTTTTTVTATTRGVSYLAAAAFETPASTTTTTPGPQIPGKVTTSARAVLTGPGRTPTPSVSAAASAGQELVSLTPAQMIASSKSYLPTSDKGSRILSVETVQKPAAKITPTVSVEERVQRIEQDRLTEATGAHDTLAASSQEPTQVQEVTTTKASGGHHATDEDAMMGVEEEEDNDGFDQVGSLFKVYEKPKPKRKYICRYDIKLSVPPCEAPEALTELSKVLVSIWTVLREADKKLVIYPWKDGSTYAPLQKIKDMPTLLPDIGRYFNRAFPRKLGGTIYISMYLGHEKTFKTLQDELAWWFGNHGYGWYIKPLQCERSICIGWLLYSTLDMDREQLAEEIRRKIGVKVGMRFRTISVNSKQKLSKDQMVGAIHIEIDERNYASNKEKISRVYESKQTQGFPLGIKMRLCPQVQDATDPTTSSKFDRVRIRQGAFLANVQKTNTRDVGVLDYPDPLLFFHTIRSMVMDIRSTQDPEKKVFISVDKQFRGEGVCFQYSNTYIDEAAAWIKGLLPYLKTQYPQISHVQLEKCFSEDAVSRSAACVWDSVRKCVVSNADNMITALIDDLDLDDEYEFPDTDTSRFELDISAVQQRSNPPARKSAKRANDPNDADSVSTFKRQRENIQAGVATSNQYAALESSTESSVASAASSTVDVSRGTAESFKTRASSVAGTIQSDTVSQQSSIDTQGSNTTGKSNVSSASAAIIKQRDQTIDEKNLQIQAIMDQLRGFQMRFDPAGNASIPHNSQPPRQASLDNELTKAGDGDVSGKSLE